jgi:hypothetical protein
VAGGSILRVGNFSEDIVGDGDFVGVDVDDFAVAHEDHGDVAGSVLQDGAVKSTVQSRLDLGVFLDNFCDRFMRCISGFHARPLLLF